MIVCAEEEQLDGNLTRCVFVYVRIRDSQRSNSAGKIIKHTACSEDRPRNVSFDGAFLYSRLCRFPLIDGETL